MHEADGKENRLSNSAAGDGSSVTKRKCRCEVVAARPKATRSGTATSNALQQRIVAAAVSDESSDEDKPVTKRLRGAAAKCKGMAVCSLVADEATIELTEKKPKNIEHRERLAVIKGKTAAEALKQMIECGRVQLLYGPSPRLCMGLLANGYLGRV